MSRVLAVLAVAAAALAAGVAPAGATNECRGLMVCVPIAGPWVLVPTGRSVPRPQVEYRLSCPRGYVVGGLDAELSDHGIDVSFLGALGSPVNPGITTARAVVFVATYVGASARAPSFRPHIGCMPSSGGGGIPTAVTVFPPGKPTVRRVRTVRLQPGRRQRIAVRCTRRETLVDAAHAIGFYTRRPPVPGLASSVAATRSVRGSHVVVATRADAELGGIRAVVQVQAVCARAR